MTLVDLSAQIRVLAKWLLVALAVIFVAWLFWLLISGVSRLIFGSRAADVAFGNIPPPLFTKTYGKLVSDSFEVNTTLPAEEEDLKGLVYKVSASVQLDDDGVEKISSAFGLGGAEQQENSNEITLTGANDSKTLKINKSLGSVDYRLNYKKDSSVISEKTASKQKDLVKKVQTLLEEISLPTTDLDMENPSVRFLTIDKSKSSESTFGEANSVELSFSRQVNGEPTVGSPPLKILFGGSSDRVLELHYSYLLLEKAPSAYPIITQAKAWEIAKSGLAFVNTKEQFKKTTLTKVSLV